MEEFRQLFNKLLAFVYECFDRIVIHGYLSGLSRPEQVVYFVRQILGVPVVSKEGLRQRTREYNQWVQAYAHNHHLPLEWAQKRVRKEDHVLPYLARLVRKSAYGVYFIFQSMEQGPASASADRNTRVQTRTTALWPRSTVASGIITSTSGMRSWDRSCCALAPSCPFRPPIG